MASGMKDCWNPYWPHHFSVSAKKSGVWNYHLQFEIIRMLKISHEKNEFLYGAQRVVFSNHSCHSSLEVVLFWVKFNA